MSNELRVTVELGPKGKRAVAVAPDWPGLERGAKSAEGAIETLRAYLPRYARVTELARMEAEFRAVTEIQVAEQYRGTGSTDFWGISFAPSSIDGQPLSIEELERQLLLLRACWAFFDDVRGRASAEMRKGPRGGGRDRDRIASHVLAAEQDWAKKVGVLRTGGGVVTDEPELTAYRDTYCTAIRRLHSMGQPARGWPLRYLIRHSAYHTMDHAWEMQDKDLSGAFC